MTQRSRKPAVPRGRPTADQARKRQKELLKKSMDLFMKKGFDAATMEAIESSVRMTKRTIYGYYPTKEALFKAAVREAINENYISLAALRDIEGDDLEATLVALAHLRVESLLTPAGIGLYRLIIAESFRFPDLVLWAFEQNVGPTIYFLVDLFNKHIKAGHIAIDKLELAARMFLNMAVSDPVRRVLSGINVRDPVALDEHIRYGVNLFLRGVQRPATSNAAPESVIRSVGG